MDVAVFQEVAEAPVEDFHSVALEMLSRKFSQAILIAQVSP